MLQRWLRLFAAIGCLALAAPALAASLAVLPLVPGDRSEAHAGLGAALAGMLVTDLVVAGAQLVEREQLDALMAEIQLGKSGYVDEATAAQLGKGIGAGQLVIGSYVVLDGELLLDARVVDVASGRVLTATDAKGPLADYVAVEKQLAERLIEALGLTLSAGDRRRLLLAAPTERFDAFSAYAQARQAELEGKITEAREAYATAARLDPDFSAASAALAGLRQVIGDDRRETHRGLSEARRALAERYAAQIPRYAAGEPLDDQRWAKLALRWAMLGDLGRDCDAAQERWAALAAAGWPESVFSNRESVAVSREVEAAGWTTLTAAEYGPAISRVRIVDRVGRSAKLSGAVIDGLSSNPRGTTDALVGSLFRCGTDFPGVLKRLERELVNAGHPYANPDGKSLTVTERVRLLRLWHESRMERPPANVSADLTAVLEGWPATTPGGVEARQRVDAIDRDALNAQKSRLRRSYLPDRALVGIANAALGRPSTVRLLDLPRCASMLPVAKPSLVGALDTIARSERDQADLPLLYDLGLDSMGAMSSMLIAVGCVDGVLGRFETPEEAIAYVADARVRRSPHAEPHCDGVFDALDRATGPGQRAYAAQGDEALAGVALGAVSTYFGAAVGSACVVERLSWPF